MLNEHSFTVQDLQTGMEHRFEYMQTIPREGEIVTSESQSWKVAKVIHMNRGKVLLKANRE